MRNYRIIFFILAILVSTALFTAQIAFAQGVFQSFGGRILTINVPPNVICAGVGPIMIQPVGSFPTGPYYAPPGTNVTRTSEIPGVLILGLYSVMAPLCEQILAVPVPYPVFPLIMFGTSEVPALGF